MGWGTGHRRPSSLPTQGRFTIAAKHHISIAEIYETELVDIEKVSGRRALPGCSSQCCGTGTPPCRVLWCLSTRKGTWALAERARMASAVSQARPDLRVTETAWAPPCPPPCPPPSRVSPGHRPLRAVRRLLQRRGVQQVSGPSPAPALPSPCARAPEL